MINLARRKFITVTAGLIAAPAIVRAASLMPVRAWAWAWDDRASVEARKSGMSPDGHCIYYLTDKDAWFLIDNLKYKVTEREGLTYTDPAFFEAIAGSVRINATPIK